MLKSVQTHRLSTPVLTSAPCAPATPPRRTVSRTSSSLSTSTFGQRLSCAPDDASILSLALTTAPPPPLPPRPPTPRAVGGMQPEDPLYEEIYSAVRTESAAGKQEGKGHSRRATVPVTPAGVGMCQTPGGLPEPPKLPPVSGVLHTKNPAVVRPSAFKPFVRPDPAATPAPPPPPSAPPAKPSAPVRRSTPRNHVGKSLSDPCGQATPLGGSARGPSYRKLSATHRYTPTTAQSLYYPSSSDQSSGGSYGYGSGGCSDQSVDSWSMYGGMHGGHKVYRARMIRTDEDEVSLSDDPYHVTSTPSPSDSGIAVNYESLLREKDNEIAALRRTMELNEGVIFKVHEEKEAAWRKQLDSLRTSHDTQLRSVSSEHEAKVEEVLQANDALRQHNVQLQQQLQTALEGRGALEVTREDLEARLSEAQARLDEASWLVCEKAGQIALLKKQRPAAADQALSQQVLQLQGRLEQAQKEALQRNAELKDLRQTLNFLSQQLYQVQQKLDLASGELEAKQEKRGSLSEPPEVDTLRRELAALRLQYSAESRRMEDERQTWAVEKEKVLSYQRQLQLTYLDIYKQKCRLESQLDDMGSTLRINELIELPSEASRESDC
ncbi:LOW QUALITY PROTEIN: leucine zipper putative tumor suppressor 3-like [Paramacrobiotus metropolitanus]|uniref:LOW QUALITY PROTEIN: leucine zipper putative tumor suppressor 3-like n=1 Tax=Paramacrobiotus metropolitanus TaxID=2943436 RepID=UPI00244641C0|nr:LOW QUALITY PROTEIN: leucine zipper putative tumor suppressor 3-like [Paramacrobiotus metropolitanus]